MTGWGESNDIDSSGLKVLMKLYQSRL